MSNAILQQLKERRDEMRTRFSLRRIALFGSHLLGKPTISSDIDLLIELDNPSFDHYMDLKFYLEDLFGCPVDLVLADTIKPRIKSLILESAVYA
jgi:predicted nucleotidyltransferase